MELSPNAQAILMLTAPLIVRRQKGTSEQPLSLQEYNRLAQFLRQSNLEPADLLQSDLCTIGLELGQFIQYERIQRLLQRGLLLAQVVEQWRSRAIWAVTRADSQYPARIKRKMADLAPPVLYGCGDIQLASAGGFAVVGSRNADDDAVQYARRTGELATRAQCAIISGGARGIDQAAMEGALSSGGSAVGVLSNGLEGAALSRENRDRILDERLLLLSPYDPKSGFNVGNAMARNKLVYAFADVGLILAAEYNKGGTWAGAIEQLEKFRFGRLYVKRSVPGGDGLEALFNLGACEWPDPQTPNELKSILNGGNLRDSSNRSEQISLFVADEVSEVAVAQHQGIGKVESPGSSAKHPNSPADDLLEKVRSLLAPITYPLTDASVADILGVNKSQASRWLSQLEQSGAYVKRDKPNRYIKAEDSGKDSN